MKPLKSISLFIFILAFLAGLSVVNSKAGMLLIDLSRSAEGQPQIIYINKHSFLGAEGFIVNEGLSPSTLEVARPDLINVKDAIFYGGPDSYPQNLYLLHMVTHMEGVEDVFLKPITSEHHIFDPKEGTLSLRGEYRIILGRSIWRPFALDYEMWQKKWRISEFDQKIL